MDDWMIEKVLAAKAPKVSIAHQAAPHILDLDGEKYEISLEDADLLFSTMFFRGKF